MSHEFEKIVLEKLNNFEWRFDNNEKTIDHDIRLFKLENDNRKVKLA